MRIFYVITSEETDRDIQEFYEVDDLLGHCIIEGKAMREIMPETIM